MEKLLKFIVAIQVGAVDFTNKKFADRERGATATEYALLVAFIAIAIIVGVTLFGTALSTFFSNLATRVGSF